MKRMSKMCENLVYENCPFKTIIEDWDDDDGDIITLCCEGCPKRDECAIDLLY